MKSKSALLSGLPLLAVLAFSSLAHARLLHESSRIALYSTQAEAGSGNSHPITLEAARLAAALARIRVRVHSGETDRIIDLLPEKNREEAAEQLARELRKIDPDQDLHLISFRRIGTVFSSRRKATAARVFADNGRLNLIFGQIDHFFSEFRDPDRSLPRMGSRQGEASLDARIMPAEGITFVGGRKDWVVLDLDQAVSPQPGEAPPARRSAQAPGEPSPDGAVQSQGKSIEEKLRILKDLRDKELITEEEYVEKKRQILEEL